MNTVVCGNTTLKEYITQLFNNINYELAFMDQGYLITELPSGPQYIAEYSPQNYVEEMLPNGSLCKTLISLT